MTDIVIPLRATPDDWTQSPCIAAALAAVEGASAMPPAAFMSVSHHIASRVHLPSHIVSLDGHDFFASVRTGLNGIADRVYLRAAHYLEALLRDDPFLS